MANQPSDIKALNAEIVAVRGECSGGLQRASLHWTAQIAKML